jgi:hypothetical protein
MQKKQLKRHMESLKQELEKVREHKLLAYFVDCTAIKE